MTDEPSMTNNSSTTTNGTSSSSNGTSNGICDDLKSTANENEKLNLKESNDIISNIKRLNGHIINDSNLNSNSQSSISSFVNNGINVMTNSDSKGSFSSSHSSPRPLNLNDQLNGEWSSSNANSMTNSNTNLNGKNNSPPLPPSVANSNIEKQLMSGDATTTTTTTSNLIDQQSNSSSNGMLNKNAFFGASSSIGNKQQVDGDDSNFSGMMNGMAKTSSQVPQYTNTNGTANANLLISNGQRIRSASNNFSNDLNPTLIEDQQKEGNHLDLSVLNTQLIDLMRQNPTQFEHILKLNGGDPNNVNGTNNLGDLQEPTSTVNPRIGLMSSQQNNLLMNPAANKRNSPRSVLAYNSNSNNMQQHPQMQSQQQMYPSNNGHHFGMHHMNRMDNNGGSNGLHMSNGNKMHHQMYHHHNPHAHHHHHQHQQHQPHQQHHQHHQMGGQQQQQPMYQQNPYHHNLLGLTLPPQQYNQYNQELHEERFSRKVFVGGLPPDIDEDEIVTHFRRYGNLIVDWPHKAESKSYFPPKGYAFLIFQEERNVQDLIETCVMEEGKLYMVVSSPSMKDKPVQIRPWCLADSDFVMDGSQPLDPRKTIFVGGVPRPLKAIELAMIMDKLYGGVCYAGIDTDPELKYPKGAGRVAFSNQQSYIAAISARFVQLHHGEIDKRVEVKPYVLDDQACDECQGTRCGGRFAPFFCANVTCLQYYCEACWTTIHSRPGREYHKPLVKEGADRPRPLSYKSKNRESIE